MTIAALPHFAMQLQSQRSAKIVTNIEDNILTVGETVYGGAAR